jgi:hypothetical protein
LGQPDNHITQHANEASINQGPPAAYDAIIANDGCAGMLKEVNPSLDDHHDYLLHAMMGSHATPTSSNNSDIVDDGGAGILVRSAFESDQCQLTPSSIGCVYAPAQSIDASSIVAASTTEDPNQCYHNPHLNLDWFWELAS